MLDRSLKDPTSLVMSVLHNALGEPEFDLLLCTVNRVGTVADVAADGESIVSTNGTGGRGQGVGSTQHDTASLDSVETFPDGGNNGSRGHVLDEAREEGLALKVLVVLFEVLRGSMDELHGNELETTSLKALDDVPNEPTLDTVGLDHDVGALSDRHF